MLSSCFALVLNIYLFLPLCFAHRVLAKLLYLESRLYSSLFSVHNSKVPLEQGLRPPGKYIAATFLKTKTAGSEFFLCPFAEYYLRYADTSFFTMYRNSLADCKRAGQKVHSKIAVAVQNVKPLYFLSRSFEICEINCQQSYLR